MTAFRPDCGKKLLTDTLAAYAAAKIDGKIVPFIDDMAQSLAWADLVICRAGALTLSELTAAGVGSILVPFPFAVDDHQTANAAHLSHVGAADVIQQRDLTPQRLAEKISDMMTSRPYLLQMAQAARGLALPEASQHVAKLCQECIRG